MPRDIGRGAGDYNCLGKIQQNLPVDPTQPQLVPNWVDVAAEYFAVVGKGGRDARIFQQLHPTISHVVYCRYNSNTRSIVPTRYRIVLDNGVQVLNVQSVFDQDKRHIEMELQCVEVKI